MVDPLYNHQEDMAQFSVDHTQVLNTSDPGTGKTRGTLEGYVRRKNFVDGTGRLLVVAPLSILKASWGDDISQYTNLTYSIAHGSEDKRIAAFESDSDIILINHDGVKWLVKNRHLLKASSPLEEQFSDLVIDEFTAFKNSSAQRSKAMLKVAQSFDHRVLLSGTPNPNTITDLWHPMLILDGGERLGSRFFQFRSQVCKPEAIGYKEHVRWVDKVDAQQLVGDAIMDVSIRYKFEDCVSIPENRQSVMYVDLPKKVMDAYKEIDRHSVMMDKDAILLDAIHASAKLKKMLQVLSGAVYDSSGNIVTVSTARYDLVMELVAQRDASLVAFNWGHEKEALIKTADKMGIKWALIDGTVSVNKRADIVERFQNGEYQVLFCHPQATSHGLTLTRGRTTIWTTPNYSAEQFQQFNRRIYRMGQKHKTETICICAQGTKEEEVYARLGDKLARTEDLLAILNVA